MPIAVFGFVLGPVGLSKRQPSLAESTRRVGGRGRAAQPERVHARFGVGTVWQGISTSGGWTCILSLGET